MISKSFGAWPGVAPAEHDALAVRQTLGYSAPTSCRASDIVKTGSMGPPVALIRPSPVSSLEVDVAVAAPVAAGVLMLSDERHRSGRRRAGRPGASAVA